MMQQRRTDARVTVERSDAALQTAMTAHDEWASAWRIDTESYYPAAIFEITAMDGGK